MVRRVWPMALAATTALLLCSTVLTGPAAADNHLACGDEITEDTVLTQDLGPCPTQGSGPLAGLTVVADDVTLDLNGHTITGDPATRHTMELGTGNLGSKDQPAIRLRNVSGVTVMNGTVEHFDSGIEIMHGSGNTVRNVTARDNINYRVVTGRDAQPALATPVCRLGDGISVFNSTDNLIEDNTVVGNGPLAGIALRGAWPSTTGPDRNLVRNNDVQNNNIANLTPEGAPTVCGTAELQGPLTQGHAVETVGVRVEGPGAENNRIEGNQIRDSGRAGVGVDAYVCGQGNNGGNVIVGNDVWDTGLASPAENPDGHGLAMLQQGPAGTVCVSHSNTITENTSTGNLRDGIFVGGRGSHSNVITDNVVDGNARHGISVTGPQDELPGAIGNTLHRNAGHGNAVYDAADFNPDCDDNGWVDNDFGVVNQECVGGDEVVVPPGTIAGTVTDADTGEAIAGATVTADGESTTTDADGGYLITDLDAGDSTVTADAPGYDPATETATVTGGQTTTVDFALDATVVDPQACPSGEVDTAEFTDRETIPEVHRDNVDCASLHDIVRGFADGSFGPTLRVRRDQMAAFIARTLDAADVPLPAATGERFTDVPADSTHDEDIHRLAAAGIVMGAPEGLSTTSYGPGLQVRRDQMASFLIRAVEFATGDDLASDTQAFDDVPAANTHFVNVNAAAELGLAQGFGDDTYRPAANARRDQMTTFVIRLFTHLVEE